jgi:hypothetical protein
MIDLRLQAHAPNITDPFVIRTHAGRSSASVFAVTPAEVEHLLARLSTTTNSSSVYDTAFGKVSFPGVTPVTLKAKSFSFYLKPTSPIALFVQTPNTIRLLLLKAATSFVLCVRNPREKITMISLNYFTPPVC